MIYAYTFFAPNTAVLWGMCAGRKREDYIWGLEGGWHEKR